jgi:RNA polymerase sigma-70 factor (ECF subfamily)
VLKFTGRNNLLASPLNSVSPSDEESRLIRAAQSGDISAFATLVQRHHAGVRACLAVRLSNSHDAEDLAQEAFVTAFRKLADCDPNRPIGPWLRGIAMNLLANHRRKFRAMPIGLNEELQALIDNGLPAHLPAERENAALEALRDCLDQLEGPSRLLLQARYAEGMSLDELAQRLQRKTSAVSMQLHRLRVVIGDCVEATLRGNPPATTPS